MHWADASLYFVVPPWQCGHAHALCVDLQCKNGIDIFYWLIRSDGVCEVGRPDQSRVSHNSVDRWKQNWQHFSVTISPAALNYPAFALLRQLVQFLLNAIVSLPQSAWGAIKWRPGYKFVTHLPGRDFDYLLLLVKGLAVLVRTPVWCPRANFALVCVDFSVSRCCKVQWG